MWSSTGDPPSLTWGEIPACQRRTAAQKAVHLELMLGQIANFCPIIAWDTIVKNSVSIDSIWQAIHLHWRPQPSLMPNVDSTLRRNIAQWKFVICTDLTNAFYQIPLDMDSVKYWGLVIPFHCVRAYVRSAMDMPGSETVLEKLMCYVLGDLLAECVVTILADDLFCDGNTPQELLNNWAWVPQALDHCG